GMRTLLALLYGAVFRKPVWVWWGGTLHTERGVGAVKRLVRRTFSRRAKHWISYGKSSTEYLLQLGIERKTIVEIQNSVDEEQFGGQAAAAVTGLERPTILYVGQFRRRKGVEHLVHAVATLQMEGQRCSLLFVGGGPEKAGIKDL